MGIGGGIVSGAAVASAASGGGGGTPGGGRLLPPRAMAGARDGGRRSGLGVRRSPLTVVIEPLDDLTDDDGVLSVTP